MLNMKLIREVEKEYGSLKNTPEDNPKLIQIRVDERKGRPDSEPEKEEDIYRYVPMGKFDYDRLHKLIRSSKVPQIEIARHVGVGYKTFYRKKNKLLPFNYRELEKLADYFGLFTKDLLKDKREVKKYRLKLDGPVSGFLNVSRSTGVRSVSTYWDSKEYQTIFTIEGMEAMEITGFSKVEVI